MNPPEQPFGELAAPPAWRTIDFISDLHLEAIHDQTVQVWSDYLRRTPAEAIFILGDLFEVWVGDDCLDDPGNFESRCVETLRKVAGMRDVHVMRGNRDFLLGERFAKDAHLHLIPDPCLLRFADQNWLLSHGDALCVDDTDYMAFRAMVRDPKWQADFLSLPLDKRRAIARDIRAQSEARKTSDGGYADVDAALAGQWLAEAQSETLIHGHTHRPADHRMQVDGTPTQRVVLSDWDAAAHPARLQVLRLTRAGLSRVDL